LVVIFVGECVAQCKQQKKGKKEKNEKRKTKKKKQGKENEKKKKGAKEEVVGTQSSIAIATLNSISSNLARTL
jgi:hypothetical protein